MERVWYQLWDGASGCRNIQEGLNEMIGLIFDRVHVNNDKTELTFENDNVTYIFYHENDCCESVSIEDICGDLSDLENSPLMQISESTSNTNPDNFTKKYQDYFTWTFYKFATIKGYVDVRWYGESNGYYSEAVNLKKIIKGV